MGNCVQCNKVTENNNELCEYCQEYEDYLCRIGYYDDDCYDYDYEEDKAQTFFEMACECTCGAWQNINGQTVHVADCCCGAE